MKVAAIILIAGNSSRFKSSTPKQLFSLKGKPVFEYALDTFIKNKSINDVILVVNKETKKVLPKQLNNKVKIVIGGKTRQQSVSNGLNTLSYKNDDIVIIHDGARPLIDDKIIKLVVDNAINYGAVTTGLEEENTVVEINKNNEINKFVDRNLLVKVQTPQAFKYRIICAAHNAAKDELATDDCTLVKNLGYKVKVVPGDKKLLKITTKEDIKILESMM